MELTPGARRTAFALQLNVADLADRYGLDRVGFLTLTFADHVLDAREAQKRFNSLATHVLRPRYAAYIRVLERQKSGRIHYHLLVVLPEGVDIRSGCDFEAFAEGDYRSASATLRSEWSFWRSTAKLYGFGRTELLPVRSSSEAVAKYVGKYIAKHMEAREEADKGVRLVAYSGPVMARTRFAWNGPNSKTWRRNLGGFIRMMHSGGAIPFPTEDGMRLSFGPRWAFKWKDNIAAFRSDWTPGDQESQHEHEAIGVGVESESGGGPAAGHCHLDVRTDESPGEGIRGASLGGSTGDALFRGRLGTFQGPAPAAGRAHGGARPESSGAWPS